MSRPGALRVRVPGSTANLGPGFDSIGLALGLWDEYDVTVGEPGGLRISVTGEAADDVPLDESHLVVRAMRYATRALGDAPARDLCLVARNGIPHGRGLGSSAAAIAAGVVVGQAVSRVDDWRDLAAGA